MVESAPLIGWYRLKERIKNRGAIDDKTAKTPRELGIDIDTLRRMKKHLGVRETADGKFYIEKR